VITFTFTLFSLYSQDKTSDTRVISEKEYFNIVRDSMGNKKDVTTDGQRGEQEKKGDKRINLSKGYLSYFKIVLVLALVVGAIYAIFYFIKKSLRIKDQIGEGATVLLNYSIGPAKWLQIVYIGGKYLILGVTNDNINLISEITDQKEIERLEINLNEQKVDSGNSFSTIITNFLKNNVKFKESKKEFDYENDSVEFLKKQNDRLDKM